MGTIHTLPTEKPSRLLIYSTLLNEFRLVNKPIENWSHKRHIYITSDEEIKEERLRWIVDNRNGMNSFIHQVSVILDSNVCPEIILTTDQDLIADGVQAIDDEFLDWFVNNSSCEEVEVEALFIASIKYQNGKWNYKIIIPKEEPKQGTISEAIKQVITNQLEQEIMYSEEEVKCFLNSIISEIGIRKENIEKNQDKMPIHLLEGGLIAFESSIDVIKESFEEFKKKNKI